MSTHRRNGGRASCSFCWCVACFKARHRAWLRVGLNFPSVATAVHRSIAENA